MVLLLTNFPVGLAVLAVTADTFLGFVVSSNASSVLPTDTVPAFADIGFWYVL